MAQVYEPKGAAREYSPLALNYIHGCDMLCSYCYVPKIMKRWDPEYIHSEVSIKDEKKLLNELRLSFKKHANSPHQVFISFLTDPYSHFNKEIQLTRKVLEMLLEYRIPVSILTKGGLNVLEDLDIIKNFGHNIQIGASLTFTNEYDSLKWERAAAIPSDRFEALRILHQEGIRTWASMEPVIDPMQSLDIMERTIDYVDGYKIGKLNHFRKFEEKIDWTSFLAHTISLMRSNNKTFYIKKDLQPFKMPAIVLTEQETNMDFMSLGPWQYC